MNASSGLLCAALLLGASGLATRESSEPPKRKKLAMCISGNLRTFAEPQVFQSIRPFLNGVEGIGLRSSEPDLFIYGTLASEGAKRQYHFGFKGLNVTREKAALAFSQVRPIAFSLTPEAGEVSNDNVDAYIVNRSQCFSRKTSFWSDMGHLTRSLNQLNHMQKCADLIQRNEDELQTQYDIVIFARPDLQYYVPKGKQALPLSKYKGKFLHQWDWFMLMPRRVMGNLIDPRFARPLRCNPGEVCCNRVSSSEQMLEFILGAPTNLGGYSCKCSERSEPSQLVEVGSLVRPKNSRVFAAVRADV